jgi:hypothetical protein
LAILIGNGRKIRAPEDRAAIVEAIGAEFVNLRAVGAVVEDADQELEPMAPHHFELCSPQIAQAFARAIRVKLVPHVARLR